VLARRSCPRAAGDARRSPEDCESRCRACRRSVSRSYRGRTRSSACPPPAPRTSPAARARLFRLPCRRPGPTGPARSVPGGTLRRRALACCPRLPSPRPAPEAVEAREGGIPGRLRQRGAGSAPEPGGFFAERPVVGRHRGGIPPADRRGEDEPGERLVAQRGRPGGLGDPPGELAPAGSGRAIPAAGRSPGRADDAPGDVAGTAKALESGVDLGELRGPERRELVVDAPLEAVAGRGFGGDQREEDGRERHGQLYNA